MICQGCGDANPAGARFCNGCGAALAPRCASCNAENPAGARFCNGCGASLGSAAAPATPAPRAYTPKHLADKILASRSALEGERKQVTVLFADVKGSMELADSVDPEQWHAILDKFFQILADGVHRFEGTVNQYTGDGIMALFGAPIAHEDHAQRACFAALHLRDTLREYAEELKRTRGLAFAVRIGINSGEVVVGKIGDDLRMDYTAQGQTVGLAQRMESLADPGRAYVAEATAKLVAGYFALRDLGEFALKSVREPVRVYELEGTGALQTRFDLSRARGLSHFVGRAAELATLESALERAIEGRGNVLGLVAEPGTGKSRLCFELAERARARGVPIHEAHGVPHGKQVSFLPVLTLLRGLFGIAERDSEAEARQKIAGALVLLDPSFERSLPVWFDFLGVPDSSRPAPELQAEDRERIVLEGVRRLIRARSERTPALILLEDLHWFDAASERVLATLVESVRDTRTLLLVNFRPEFHADWMQRSGYQQLPLPPLGPEAAAELLRALLGPDPALAKLAVRIAAHAGGNPFFVEELVLALVEDGSLVGAHGAYQAARQVETLALPATVQAVLASRIDRLAEREKQVLHSAAVIGPEFDAGLLGRVTELPEPELLAALRTLAQAELVLERSLYPSVVYGFKHPLTHEVALRSQLASRRAERHAATARALEALTAPEELDECAALLAHHWQEAGEKLVAARWHARAASRAGFGAGLVLFHHWSAVRALCDALPDSAEALTLGIAARGGLIFSGLPAAVGTPEIFRDEARALVARGGDPRALGSVLWAYSLFRSVADVDFEEALLSIAEAEQLADQHGDELQRQRLRPFRLIAERESGRLQQAIATAAQLVPTAPGLTTFDRANGLGNRGRLWFFLGRLGEAQQEIDSALEVAAREGLALVFLWFRVELAEVRDDPASAARDVARATENSSPDSVSDQLFGSLMLGIARAMAGEWADAAATFQDAFSLPYGPGWDAPRYRLAEAKLELGEHELARELASAAASDFARRGKRMLEIPTQLVLARALMRTGRLTAREESAAALERAEALIDQTGARVFLPRLHIERAAFAKLLGNEADRAAELREAERLFREIGAPLRADAIARELQNANAAPE